MASIIDMYKSGTGSGTGQLDWTQAGGDTKDKTPVSDDSSGNFNANESTVDQARGGGIPDSKPYSTTVNYSN
jgi:hypothetical protein